MQFPDKKSIRYPDPFSLKIERSVKQDMEAVGSLGKDVAEAARILLKEGFAKLRAQLEQERLSRETSTSEAS